VGHAGTRFRDLRPLEADDTIESRFDWAIANDGRFAGLAYTKHGVKGMVAARSFKADVYNPGTLEVTWSGQVSRGQTLPLTGKIARLVVGQLL
jgi:hypothetical protein